MVGSVWFCVPTDRSGGPDGDALLAAGGGRGSVVEVGGGILGRPAMGVCPIEKFDRVWFQGAIADALLVGCGGADGLRTVANAEADFC